MMSESSPTYTQDQVFEELALGQTVPSTKVSEEIQEQLAEFEITNRAGVLAPSSRDFVRESAVREHLTDHATHWLKTFDVRSSIASTNTSLLDLARTERINGHVLTAEVQLAGRGRRGRQWVSPFANNVMMSVGVEVDRPPSSVGPLSLVVGVAVARAFEALKLTQVQLKWPNDILIDDTKVAGILIELANAMQPAILVIGIGINVKSAPGTDVTGEYAATSMAYRGYTGSRNQVIAAVLNELVPLVEEFEQSGLDSVLQEWSERDYLKDRQILVIDGHGEKIPGLALGIDHSGAYLVKTMHRIERVIGGTLRLA